MKSKPKSTPFVSGLIVGLFAGSVMHFLTKTEEGELIRDKLAQEWQVARKKLLEDNLIDEKVPVEAEEMLHYLWLQLAQGVHQLIVGLETTKKSRRPKSLSASTKANKSRRLKFKGV